MTTLESLKNDYVTRKAELEEAAKAELQPMWAAVVAEQKAVKAAKDAEKKAARIKRLEAELVSLKA